MNKMKEIEYREKFEKLIKEQYYIKQPEEQFKQCIGQNEKYYCPYWFISNYGYIFSVAYNKLIILQPILNWGGVKKKNKKFECPEYLKKTYTGWEKEVNKGYCPQYYYYCNTYSGKNNKAIMHKIMEYYFPNSYIELDNRGDIVSNTQVHHMKMKDWSVPPQRMNQASDLQGLSDETHSALTEKSRTIISDFADDQNKAVEQGKYIGKVTQNDLLKWISIQMSNQNPYEKAMMFIVDESSQEVIEYKMLNCKDIIMKV